MQLLGLLSAAASLLVIGADAAVHGLHGAGHGGLSRRLTGDVDLNRRAVENSKWSYYDTETGNAGSCGRMISNSDFAVAMNANDYNPGNCMRSIVMTYNGKTATAQVMDRCPGCPPGGLDLSSGLFSFFASHDKGIIYGSWSWAGEGGGPAPAPAPPKTTNKPEPVWTPTSTWTPPKPTPTTPAWTPSSTWTPEPSPTSTSKSSTEEKSTSSSSSASEQRVSSTASSSSSSATPTPSVAGPSNVGGMNHLVVQMGELIVGGVFAN